LSHASLLILTIFQMKRIAYIFSLAGALSAFAGCDENKASQAVTNDHPEQEAPGELRQVQEAAITEDTLSRPAAGELPGQAGQQSQGQAGQTTQPNRPQGQ
jgi:hypothetical protein